MSVNVKKGILSQESNFLSLADKVLEVLSERSKDIIKKRFGLTDGKRQTLDSIGKEYRITRERVRQIISDALKKVAAPQNKGAEFKQAQELIFLEIEARSGIIKESELLIKLGGQEPKEKNSVSFLIGCFESIGILEKDELVEKSLITSGFVQKKLEEVSWEVIQLLEKIGIPLEEEKLVKELSKKLVQVEEKEIRHFLFTLSRVSKNIFGKWGMSHWPEIHPKSTRDKIYLVLKETGQPLHFSEIAKKIDELGLSKKKAHPQTVHNELIKDDRFVLIGRGIYALSQWGYSKGTVRETLQGILKKGPLSKEEIFEKIFKIRKVKKATVMINLNNTRFFQKENDRYKLKG